MADDPPGFRDFVVARSPALLRLAWMLTLDGAAAEDLLQTALARTWPHWGRVAAGSPEAYVRQVMVRTAGSWRRRRWTGEVPGDLPDVASTDETAAHDERLVLTRALAALPPGQRRVVVLRYYADLSEAEVAGLVGCSVGTVKSQAAKGLSRLRSALGEPAPGEPALGEPERRPT